MLEIGSFLSDRYEILSKVGAGGMSDVYKAKDHILSRFVAIKVLKQEFSEDSSFVTKFRAEAQSAAGLEHPNIVNIYDVGSENGLYYIVMEYVEGITLKTYIEKKGQLSFKESASIAIQVARGIEAAHNKNIIHRDIKPQNIIISTDGKVKVTDFGIAKATSSNTISSDVMGSVHYASPEQARNGFVDGRSDIYSLGIVMFEMVTGRVPFDGDTTVAVALQHLQEEIARPSIYAPDLPISFEKIILKCTQKTPDRRYQTIEELLTDIRRSLAHPDEDFVTIAPLVDGGKTKVISPEELDKIKEGRGVAEDLNDDDTDADNGDGAEIADAEHTLEVENLNQCDRTRIQDGRQHSNDIRDQEQQREQAHGEGIVAHLEEFRDGCDAAAQQLGQEHERQHDQRERRGGLPCHRTHVARKRLSVRADKLFCGKVGHHQRTGDNDAGQSASCEEVAFLGGQVVIACFPPREHRDKHGERDKGCDSKCHFVVFPLAFFTVWADFWARKTASPF